jgi:hypothetical protein
MFEKQIRPTIEFESSRRHLSHGEKRSVPFISFFRGANNRATTHPGSARHAVGAIETAAY